MIHIVALGLPRNQRGTGPWINKYGVSPAFGFLLALGTYTGADNIVGMLGGKNYILARKDGCARRFTKRPFYGCGRLKVQTLYLRGRLAIQR